MSMIFEQQDRCQRKGKKEKSIMFNRLDKDGAHELEDKMNGCVAKMK